VARACPWFSPASAHRRKLTSSLLAQKTHSILRRDDLDGTLAEFNEFTPGAYVHYNIDDDNGKLTRDCDEAATDGREDDLKRLEILADDSLSVGTVTLSRSNTAAVVWKSPTKGAGNGLLTGSTLEKTWDLSDAAQRSDFNSVKATLYVEGVQETTAGLKVKYEGGGVVVEDMVIYTFIAATCGWQPEDWSLYPDRRGPLQSLFRKLVGCEWSVTDYPYPFSEHRYNCIAWSVGIDTYRIWGQVDDPPYGDDDDIIESSDFDGFYWDHGYTLAYTIEEAHILLYSDPSEVREDNPEGITHAARVVGLGLTQGCDCGAGKWTMFESRCGDAERLEHARDQLNSPGRYGSPFRYYKSM